MHLPTGGDSAKRRGGRGRDRGIDSVLAVCGNEADSLLGGGGGGARKSACTTVNS